MRDVGAKRRIGVLWVAAVGVAAAACRPSAAVPAPPHATAAIPTAAGIVDRLHVPLDRVARISRFRSGVGHDYSDGVERCRSMKHYFAFRNADGSAGEPGRPHDPPWTTVPVVAPLDGTVEGVRAEWAGDQVRLRSAVDPRVVAVVFHVRRAAGIDVGAVLRAGQPIGTHASDETMSDLAVEVADASAPQGRRLLSVFDPAVMDDAAFAALSASAGWGAAGRSALVIGQGERDAAPLRCEGERFVAVAGAWAGLTTGGGAGETTGGGMRVGPSDWVVLQGP